MRWMVGVAPPTVTFQATGLPHAWPTTVPLLVKSGLSAYAMLVPPPLHVVVSRRVGVLNESAADARTHMTAILLLCPTMTVPASLMPQAAAAAPAASGV